MLHAIGENLSCGYAPISELVVELFPWLLVTAANYCLHSPLLRPVG